MARSGTRSQRAFAVAVGLMLTINLFFPTSWLLHDLWLGFGPWPLVLASIVNVPVQPLGDFGVRFRNWLWKQGDPLADESERVQILTDQFEELRAVTYAKQLTIEALQEEVRELQEAHRLHEGTAHIVPLFARITSRSPDRAGGIVRLNAGSRHGVTAGTVAVFRGGHLIGRVAGDVGRLSSWLIPITDPATGFLEVVILPADELEPRMDKAPRVLLRPDGTGGLVGDLDKSFEVSRGDIAVLSDPSWPLGGQGMKVGRLESVTASTAQPLLETVLVRPQFHAHRLGSVTLKIEVADDADEGDLP